LVEARFKIGGIPAQRLEAEATKNGKDLD